MAQRYVINYPDIDFFEHANLYDPYYMKKLKREFEPYRWGDETRLELLETVLRRLDGSKTKEDGSLLQGVQPLVRQSIYLSEKVMENIVHSQDKQMKERTAELIRRLLVDWTI